MGKMSPFHSIYESNQKEIDLDARMLTQQAFMLKYKIGAHIYDIHFKGKSQAKRLYIVKNSENRDKERQEKHSRMIEKAKMRQESCTEYFNAKVKELAEAFGISEQYILFLSNDYSISEIEKAKVIDWELVVTDIIQMHKPKSYADSMFSYSTSML